MKEVVEVNKKQFYKVIEKLQSVYPKLSGKTVSILGLSFKPNTNDLREAPSIKIINELYNITNGHIHIKVYDPISMEEASNQLPSSVDYCHSVKDAVRDTDVAVIVTEWKEIIEQDWNSLASLMKKPVIIDGRNCLGLMHDESVTYLGIGRKKIK